MLGGGGGVLGLLSVRPHFCWGGVGAAKGLLPYFLVPKGNQPTACTLALWWLKFGPTGGGGGGMDGLWTEVCGQQKQSNDPGNNQHILNTPIIGRR